MNSTYTLTLRVPRLVRLGVLLTFVAAVVVVATEVAPPRAAPATAAALADFPDVSQDGTPDGTPSPANDAPARSEDGQAAHRPLSPGLHP